MVAAASLNVVKVPGEAWTITYSFYSTKVAQNAFDDDFLKSRA